MRDAFFALTLLASMPLTIMYPSVSVVFWVWAAMTDVKSFMYGFMIAVPVQKLLVGTTVVSLMVGKGTKRFYFDATFGLMLALLMWTLLAQSVAIADPNLSDGWTLFDKIWKILLLGFMIMIVAWDRIKIHAIILAVILGLGLIGMWEGVLLFVSGGSHKVEGSLALGDNNEIGLLMGMCVPLAYYVAQVSANQIVRLASLGACVFFVASVIATNSRGAFAGLVVMAVTVAMFSNRKLTTLMAIGVFAGLLVLAAPSSWTERISTVEKANQDDSFMGRVIAWKISTLIALDRPFTGGGLHAIQNKVVWDTYKKSVGDLSFIPTDEPDVIPHAAHSMYFELLGDTGFPGLLIFLSLVANAFVNARAIKRITRGRADLVWAHKLTNAIQLSFLMFMTSGAALSTAYYELHFVLMAVLSVTRRQLEFEIERARRVAAAAGTWRGASSSRWTPKGAGAIAGRAPASSQSLASSTSMPYNTDRIRR